MVTKAIIPKPKLLPLGDIFIGHIQQTRHELLDLIPDTHIRNHAILVTAMKLTFEEFERRAACQK